MTQIQRNICKKYSARGEDGKVSCSECPMVIDHYNMYCIAQYEHGCIGCKHFEGEYICEQCVRNKLDCFETNEVYHG